MARVQREQRDRENHEGDGADDVRRQDSIGRKEVAGDARQHGRGEEQGGPTRQPVRAEHAEEHDEAGTDADEADDDVKKRERRS